MNKPIRMALTKGRLEKTTIELLEKIGYNCDEVKNKDYSWIRYEYSGSSAFIFGNFVRIRSYKVCTADKGFLGSGV